MEANNHDPKSYPLDENAIIEKFRSGIIEDLDSKQIYLDYLKNDLDLLNKYKKRKRKIIIFTPILGAAVGIPLLFFFPKKLMEYIANNADPEQLHYLIDALLLLVIGISGIIHVTSPLMIPAALLATTIQLIENITDKPDYYNKKN